MPPKPKRLKTTDQPLPKSMADKMKDDLVKGGEINPNCFKSSPATRSVVYSKTLKMWVMIGPLPEKGVQ